jgi:hypothetical protein
MNKSNYFFCYDRRLANYLRHEKRIDFITEARHLKTNKIFTLFYRNEELKKSIR